MAVVGAGAKSLVLMAYKLPLAPLVKLKLVLLAVIEFPTSLEA
jgi:hypothetical protein